MKLKSISNRKLTLLRKLKRKKYRQQEQLFIVEGARAVQQIIESRRLEIKGLFFDYSEYYWEQKRWKSFTAGIESSLIEKDHFAEISDTDNPQGVIALCEMPAEAATERLAQGSGLIIATDAIQDPGNMGTIIRTAGWFGIQGLLSGKGTVDLFHPKVVRSTAGAMGTIPHANIKLEETLPVFEKNGWNTLLLDAGADSVSLREINKQDKIIVVIGNEANGIRPALFTPERQKVRIDSPSNGGHVESLNAAIATSIALYALG